MDQEPSPEFIAAQLRKPSGDFATDIASGMDESNKPLYELVVSVMQPTNQDQLLEIGFASGTFFQSIFDSAPRSKILGLDYSADMVRLAQKNNSRYIKSGALELFEGSSDDMPFKDASFSKAFCINVIYFWDKPEDHLREIKRVLRPGGKFYTGMRSKERIEKNSFAEFGFTLYTPLEWQQVLERNGFSVLQTKSGLDKPNDTNPLESESFCIEARLNPSPNSSKT